MKNRIIFIVYGRTRAACGCAAGGQAGGQQQLFNSIFFSFIKCGSGALEFTFFLHEASELLVRSNAIDLKYFRREIG